MLYLEVISRRANICLLENQKERRETVIEKIENKFLREKKLKLRDSTSYRTNEKKYKLKERIVKPEFQTQKENHNISFNEEKSNLWRK